jgi:phosphate/sulfate permease
MPSNSFMPSWPTYTWILAVGGIMIGIGFCTYGFNLMRSLGNNLT